MTWQQRLPAAQPIMLLDVLVAELFSLASVATDYSQVTVTAVRMGCDADADLETPEYARMPILDTDGWPTRRGP